VFFGHVLAAKSALARHPANALESLCAAARTAVWNQFLIRPMRL